MRKITAQLIRDKRVLLRLDLDVPLKNGKVIESFRLDAGLETLDFCLEHAKSVIVLGHLGRPNGKDPKFSVKPVVDWFEKEFAHVKLTKGKFHILENLRFDKGEEECNLEYAKELASLGDVFINDAFASHHKASSTTVLPKLLPSAAGFRFIEEVEKLNGVRAHPKKPFVAIIGGAKLEDKLPVINVLAKNAEAVLVGGKLPAEILKEEIKVADNVLIGQMTHDGFDLRPEVIEAFAGILSHAKQVVWAGPMGKFEDGYNLGNLGLAKAIVESKAESIIGGGDTIAALSQINYLDKMSFVSTGGGAMLKFLEKGTLPTIEALS